MANWISSKLKVAENLLQQIDQQAAESLRKPDRSTSFDHNDGDDAVHSKKQPSVYPSATADEPVPLKLQLNKKSKQSGRPRDPNYKLKDQRRENAAVHAQVKAPNSVSKAEDGDWTQLLGSDPSPSSTGSGSIRRQKSVKRKEFPVLNEKKRISGAGVIGEKKFVVSVGEESFRKEISLAKNVIERQSEGASHLAGLVDKDNDGSSSVGILPVDSIANDVAGVDSSHPAAVDGGPKFRSEDGHDQNEIQKTETRNLEGAVIGSSALSTTTVGSSAPHGSSRSEAGSSEKSDSETDSGSSYDSEIEREKQEEHRRRREHINAEKAAEAIKEREDTVAKLEGEKQSLEKILEERKKQQEQEASELQISMMETMEAVDLEKQRHNSTRMEALPRVAALESTNAELARSLATNQWELEVEVHRISEMRQQVEFKKSSLEDIRRKMSKFHQSAEASSTETVNESEYKEGILEAEHSLLCDKIGYSKEKARKIEENIEIIRKEIMEPSEVEVELKGRLEQLTDRLIQKQTQVEALSSEKAMLLFRIETLLKFLDNIGLSSQLADLPAGLDDAAESTAGVFVKVDIGQTGGPFNSKSRNPFPRIQSAEHHFWSFLRQLDSIFSAGALFLRKNPMAKTWAIVYLICLHLWFVYVFSSHSISPNATRSGAVLSLETINKTTRS